MKVGDKDFYRLFRELRQNKGMNQKAYAFALGISHQYVCDLEKERRLPSVRVVNAICDWLVCTPTGIRLWHTAAARAHGWEVTA